MATKKPEEILKGRIVIYTLSACPHCIAAKFKLKEAGLPYHEVDLAVHPEMVEYVYEETGKRSVPQIFFNSIHVGGNSDLQEVIADKPRWEALIQEVRNNSPPPDAPLIPSLPSNAGTSQQGSHLTEEFSCEDDEFAGFVKEFKNSGLIATHWRGVWKYPDTFSGKDFVKWFEKNQKSSRERAILMGQYFLTNYFAKSLDNCQKFKDNGSLYRLLENEKWVALNACEPSTCRPMQGTELGELLRRQILALYSKFLSNDGLRVDYMGIRDSNQFKEYVKMTQQLARCSIMHCFHQEKVAFFINIYNALVIHGIVVRGAPVSLWQRWKFFTGVRYIIGGLEYSLQDIENGVLRANQKGIGMLTKPFGKHDPRLAIALKKPEPLIHFALVCGAKSCPPIKTYQAANVDHQLRLAAEAFLDSPENFSINVDKFEVKLSSIFKWYRVDFGNTDDEVLRFLADLIIDTKNKATLFEMLNGTSADKIKIVYAPYDWSINT